ncbi:MAG: winged helix DNA-binding domain-containing protein, partial [Clostridia bacterium]|nr:winged helix DNA-binding domain-containing protein [Clostridia bacterium]
LFMHCGNGRDYRRNEWSGYSFWNRRDAWALTPERQKTLADTILDALSAGPRTREELKEICRLRARMTSAEEDSMFNQWGGGIREMCERGFLHYAVKEDRTFVLSPDFAPIPEEDAMREIARRYFTYYGPASVHDAMYWFHATASQVKGWLEELPVTAAECGGRTYYYIPHETSSVSAPRCIFLAGFDPLMLGYEKKESLFLPQAFMRGIFNLAGIVMPAVLLDGTVVGKWRKKGKQIAVSLFDTISTEGRAEIRRAAESLWPDGTVSVADPAETP